MTAEKVTLPNVVDGVNDSAASPTTDNNEQDKKTSPTLFQDCVSFWGASLMSPTTANLRSLARRGLLTDPEDAERILNLPVTLDVFMHIFLKYKDILVTEYAHDPGVPMHVKVMEMYQKSIQNPQNVSLLIFDDDRAEQEIVYGILVNPTVQRIYLTFRGSVTKRDYEADAKFLMRRTKDYRGKTIKVHSGFSAYLFGTIIKPSKKKSNQASQSPADGDEQNDNPPTVTKSNDDASPNGKYDVIVQSLQQVCEKYPNFELCVTGHSLGGALALLTVHRIATEAKLQGKFRGPVRSFGFGSLLVGDIKFLRSFQSLEQQDLLRSTVIMNEGDVIPLLPLHSGLNFYRGVSERIVLSKKGRRPIFYKPPKSCCPFDLVAIPGFTVPRFFYVLFCHYKFWENHTVSSTTDCIMASEKWLSKYSLDELYEEEDRIIPLKI
jgi:hypothetical protein